MVLILSVSMGKCCNAYVLIQVKIYLKRGASDLYIYAIYVSACKLLDAVK